MMEQKQQLRKLMREKLQAISREQKQQWSTQIAAQLYEQPEWKNAKTIGVTVSVNDEVMTHAIIEQAWREGKEVAVPKCNRSSQTLQFRAIQRWSDLEQVYMNLQEPIISITKELHANEMDVLLLPGIAFTAGGDRLGYGGGYYDRFLVAYKGKTVALAYEAQLVSEIPMDVYDKQIQTIITETNMYRNL